VHFYTRQQLHDRYDIPQMDLVIVRSLVYQCPFFNTLHIIFGWALRRSIRHKIPPDLSKILFAERQRSEGKNVRVAAIGAFV